MVTISQKDFDRMFRALEAQLANNRDYVWVEQANGRKTPHVSRVVERQAEMVDRLGELVTLNLDDRYED